MSDERSRLLYLVRHGEAKSKDEDPERPLTSAGANYVARMARWTVDAGIRVDEIRHSGKLRAKQTAGLLAEYLPGAPVPLAVSGLGPNDNVELIAQQLQEEVRRIMLVGHLPFLERLASFLVAEDANAAVATLDAGALLALEKSEDGWSVVFLVQPKPLPRP